jgi:hypothetical protein
MTKEELTLKYEKELSDTLQMFNVRRIEDIPEKPYQWSAGSIRNFIRDIKNLNGETVKSSEGFHTPSVIRCDKCLNISCTCK